MSAFHLEERKILRQSRPRSPIQLSEIGAPKQRRLSSVVYSRQYSEHSGRPMSSLRHCVDYHVTYRLVAQALPISLGECCKDVSSTKHLLPLIWVTQSHGESFPSLSGSCL